MSDGVRMDPGTFALTPELINHVVRASLAASSLALALCLFVCLASAWIYSVPSARHHLDRVSFRLFLWGMLVEIPYCVCFILVTQDKGLIHQSTACGVTVYFLLATMGICNWLCTCIGLNLMLAISFGVNPIQSRLERWYVLGSFTLGFGVPLVPAILGHFGYDALYQGCYFTESRKVQRIRNFVLDLYFWQLLSCVVAATCVLIVLITLFRRSRATERALFSAHTLAITSSELREITSTANTSSPLTSNTPASRARWYARIIPGREARNRSRMHRLQDKLAIIALKISLYPLALLLINVVITAEDLAYTSRGGLFTAGQYFVYWLHNFLYGGRGIFFALLGISVDPCLRKGLPAAWRASRRRAPKPDRGLKDSDDTQSITDFLGSTGPEYSVATPHLASQTATPRSGGKGRWFGLGGGRDGDMASVGREIDVEMVGSEKDMEKADMVELRKSMAVERDTDSAAPPQSLSVIIDSPAHPPPVLFSPLPSSPAPSPTPRSPRLDLPSNPDWIQPLASAILTRAASPGLGRRSSDPALGAAARRRRELEEAAVEMYAQAQMRL